MKIASCNPFGDAKFDMPRIFEAYGAAGVEKVNACIAQALTEGPDPVQAIDEGQLILSGAIIVGTAVFGLILLGMYLFAGKSPKTDGGYEPWL